MNKIYLLVICSVLSCQLAHAQIYQQNGVTVAGGNGLGSAANQLDEPNNVVVDANKNLIIADLNNNRIQKWAAGASFGTTIAGGNGLGTGANQFNHTTDVRFDAVGNMYVADFINHRVQKFAPGSTTGVTVAGGNGPGAAANQLYAPAGIFVDPAGIVYVADYYNARIQKWLPGATAGITVAGGNQDGAGANQLNMPNDVFVDGAGNIFVADQSNHRIQKWAPGATQGFTVAGGNGQGTAANQLNFPTGIWLDPAGNILIADFLNERVQRWVPGASSGITIAGGNGQGFGANQFFHPLNLMLDTDGTLYVCDVYNHRVQRFDLVSNCPANVVVAASSCAATATIAWKEPRDTFPGTITLPVYLDPAMGVLSLMGTLNGHGYYKSTGTYLWPVAQSISEFIGDTGVNGHLVTITSEAESAFLTNLSMSDNLTPWIGLYSTGKPGGFRWITGEPFAYSKWAGGEPNNNLGNAANVAEPFVHMYSVGLWNDQRNVPLRFITEFEKPLISYRQVSGPANGSRQSAGVYNICYERTDGIMGVKDTCCFSVTVTCPATPAATTFAMSSAAGDVSSKGLQVSAFPNPSTTRFTLNITSGSPEKIDVQVRDITGKVVERRSGLAPNQTIQIGSKLRTGVYFVELQQGAGRLHMKMVKQ